MKKDTENLSEKTHSKYDHFTQNLKCQSFNKLLIYFNHLDLDVLANLNRIFSTVSIWTISPSCTLIFMEP